MAKRPPTTDFRGGKASENSFVILMANLVVAYAVAFQSDLFSGAALESVVSFEGPARLIWSLSETGKIWSEMATGSVLRERACLAELSGMNLCAYHLIPDHEGSRA